MGAGKEGLQAGQELVVCDRAGSGDGDSTERRSPSCYRKVV